MSKKKDLPLDKQLIKYGFISEHIPPCFHSDVLFKHHETLRTSVEIGNSEPLATTIAKNENYRREIKIPNAEQQLKLFHYLLDQFDHIKQMLENNVHSLSNPIRDIVYRYDEDFNILDIVRLREKYNFHSNFTKNLARKLNYSMGYKYVYKLDLSTFYDSIYTHVIEWAVIGREQAKKELKKKRKNMGRNLDLLVADTNSKETSGIPTGPYSSRIISEIVLHKVDKELENLFHDELVDFLHYVDDYEFYFRNESDYFRLRHKIRNVFMQYRLRINENKSEFLRYPYHSNTDLKREFQHFIDLYKHSKRANDARYIFFKADYFVEAGLKGAYKYLYKQINKVNFSDDWTEVEPFIIGHLSIMPSLTQYIITLILKHKSYLSERFITELKINLNNSIKESLDNESQWIFWLLVKIDHRFKVDELKKILTKSNDDLLTIMILDYIHINHKQKTKTLLPIIENILGILETEEINGEKWLIIYEWVIHKWHGYQRLESIVDSRKFYKAMKKRKITFFKSME